MFRDTSSVIGGILWNSGGSDASAPLGAGGAQQVWFPLPCHASPPSHRGRWIVRLWCFPFQHRGKAERDLLGNILRDARQDHNVATTTAIFGRDASPERARIVRISRGLVLEEDPRGTVLEHLFFGNTDGSEEPRAEWLELLSELAGHYRYGRCGVVKCSRAAHFTEWHPFRRHCNLTG